MSYDIPADHHQSAPGSTPAAPQGHVVTYLHRSGDTHRVAKAGIANAESEVASARDGGGVWVRRAGGLHFWPWHAIVDITITQERKDG